MTNVMLINTSIVKSIPIDKDLKRYLVSWYRTMSVSNGLRFANSTLKQLRSALTGYRADPNRIKNRDSWLKEMPIRKNWRLVQLIQYMDVSPHAVLCLLKLYTSEASGVVSVEESQDSFHTLLSSIDQEPEVPKSLKLWLQVLKMRRAEIKEIYHLSRVMTDSPYHYVVKHHSIDQWMSYWTTWRGRLLGSFSKELRKDYSLARVAKEFTPNPSMYSDYSEGYSEQFVEDVMNFASLPVSEDKTGPTGLDSDIFDWLDSVTGDDRLINLFDFDDLLPQDFPVVGKVHHIPKKGSDQRRPIAVPNRFLQLGLVPLQRFLYQILRRLPRDHTFDQSKSTRLVENRLNNGHYTASIDLSHATDYLPKCVFDYIIDSLGNLANDDIAKSRELFDFMSRADWENGLHFSRWKVGQPLGTLPSFGALALEHNLLLESVSLECGYTHSPYVVLGDDVLVFSKRIRKAYLLLMQDLGVPISLSKSFEHNLVEFAGRTFVANQPAGYTPDHTKVTWYNLFDWSRSSGLLLSYRELPSKIRNKLGRKAKAVSLPGSRFYRLCAELYFAYSGSPYKGYMEQTMSLLPTYVSLQEDRVSPDPVEVSGWTVIDYGYPFLIYTHPSILRTEGMSDWKRKKFKPSTTNAIVGYTMRSVASATVHDRE